MAVKVEIIFSAKFMNRSDKIQSLNRQSYEVAAPIFDKTRNHLWPEVAALLATVKAGERIVDLGCGNGRLLNGLPSVNVVYTGIDANEHLLQQARERYPQHTFVRQELPDKTTAIPQCNLITAIAFLHHVPRASDRLRLLQQAYEALSPEGRLIITVWNLWQKRYMTSFFQHWWLKSAWNDCFLRWNHGLSQPVWRYYHAFRPRELERLVRRAGFTITYFNTKGHNFILEAKKHSLS